MTQARNDKSCHSDQGLAEIQTFTGTECGTVSCPQFNLRLTDFRSARRRKRRRN